MCGPPESAGDAPAAVDPPPLPDGPGDPDPPGDGAAEPDAPGDAEAEGTGGALDGGGEAMLGMAEGVGRNAMGSGPTNRTAAKTPSATRTPANRPATTAIPDFMGRESTSTDGPGRLQDVAARLTVP
jgi:hypothetical protein